LIGIVLGMAVVPAAAGSGHRRIQEIPLKAGWNAVFLEVEPADPAPAKVFAGLPVDKVATLFQSPVTNQFVTDPGVELFKGQGWGVWYAPGTPEAFLKSLDAINGNRAYLVHAKSACQWRASGDALLPATEWRADAFHFVGFPVSATGGPTFGQFFAGSKAHKDQAIYRLADGGWPLEESTATVRGSDEIRRGFLDILQGTIGLPGTDPGRNGYPQRLDPRRER
jgi:hypothetical protein